MVVHLRDVIFIFTENFCLKVVSDIWQFIKWYEGRVRYSNHQYNTTASKVLHFRLYAEIITSVFRPKYNARQLSVT
jgi:hypothetical protein